MSSAFVANSSVENLDDFTDSFDMLSEYFLSFFGPQKHYF